MTASPAAIDPAADKAFAARIAGGDVAAFTELMRKHNRRLFRTARAILHDDAEAEDALQEAYLAAYRALPTFRGDAKLSTWLVRIVANEALGRLRKISRTASSPANASRATGSCCRPKRNASVRWSSACCSTRASNRGSASPRVWHCHRRRSSRARSTARCHCSIHPGCRYIAKSLQTCHK